MPLTKTKTNSPSKTASTPTIIIKSNSSFHHNNNQVNNDDDDDDNHHHDVVITPLFGAVVGDIAGSTYERKNCKSESCEIFPRHSQPTDDSILTLATAHHLLLVAGDGDSDGHGGHTSTTTTEETVETSSSSSSTYTSVYYEFGNATPKAGYGYGFRQWLKSNDPQPYNSWGNGSAMRSSPIGWIAPTLNWALQEAERSASVTHNHPFGIHGSQAIAASIYLLRTGSTKHELQTYLEQPPFNYNLQRKVSKIRKSYKFDTSCEGSVPEAIISFLESTNFEDCIRKAISIGGDSDTIACMAGSLAHAYYGSIPTAWVEYCRKVMTKEQLAINDSFWTLYSNINNNTNDNATSSSST